MVTKIVDYFIKKFAKKKNHYECGENGLAELRELTAKLTDKDQELWRLESIYKCMVKNYNDVVVLTRPDGSVAYLSANCQLLLGHTHESLMNILSLIVYEPDKEKVNDIFKRALNGETGTDERYRIVTASGEIKNVSYSWAPIFVENELYLIAGILKQSN